MMNPTSKIICVIKTDAYGHGAVAIAKEVEQFDYVFGFAVATVEEANILRKTDIQKPIIILGYTFPYAYEMIVQEELRPAVFRLDMAEQLSQAAVQLEKTCRIHIKVDTGMGRIGVLPNQEGIDIISKISQLPGLEIEGIFTHFSKSDEKDKTFANRQLALFQQFYGELEKVGIKIPIHHASNSAGILELPHANLDLVRAGITLYGLEPSHEIEENFIQMRPVLTLQSHIVYLKEVPAGTPISYGGTFVTQRNTKIATIPVGYGDGYPRKLSNCGSVLVKGKRAPIIGRVCMDQFMVDVTDIKDISYQDVVTLIGDSDGERITMEEIGDLSGRFNYELACDLGKRIPRVYRRNGSIVRTKDYFEDYE